MRVFCLVLFALSLTAATAQDVLTHLLAPPSAPLTAGGQGSVWLYCMNNSNADAMPSLMPSLKGKLTSAAFSTNLVLSLNTDDHETVTAIPAGRFAKYEYVFKIPLAFAGPVRLEIGDYHQVAMLDVGAAAGVMAQATTGPAPKPPAAGRPTAPLLNVLSNNVIGHISAYEPIYFILGSYPAAEFQYSLKYKVWDFDNHQNPVDHLYFAFTQTSLWDLNSPDPSFYDSSYKPSAFLYYQNILGASDPGRFQLDLQGGTEHESNGRGGIAERSQYTVYLQPTATIGLPYNFDLIFQPRARAYYWIGHNNPDIADYRGYADLLAALQWQQDPQDSNGEKIQFATKFQIGENGEHAGLKFDLRFNLAIIPPLKKFNPTIQVQYFTGYGQSLRQYNEDSHAFRVGLCLVY